MRIARHSILSRLKNLEAKIKPPETDPFSYMIGDISLGELHGRLLSYEFDDFSESLSALAADGAAEDAELRIEALISIAIDRREEGIIAIQRRRSIKEIYDEMISRQRAGERVHYGDIDEIDEYLGQEDEDEEEAA